uniref:DUF4346 domain-containing protein n=1 Tax=Dichotomaria marginata TaxID=268567 RepID=A0A1G4NS82_9FLOR|nr:Hypothetical protein ORF_1 [Dichotomaria marginata]SCW21517.1 Hypothetical protein ORF_1 [Dichotomaria marginata]
MICKYSESPDDMNNLLNSKNILFFNNISDKIYCKIYTDQYRNIHCVVYYDINRLKQAVLFKAKNAKKLSQLIQLHYLIYNYLSVSHAIYIGMELIKAEISLIMMQVYVQD